MAKRKRLTPPDPSRLMAPEVKEMTTPLPSHRPPIADLAGASADAAAVEELAGELTRARAEGRMIVSVPLDQIDLDHLVRDRVTADPDELTALMESLKARGQQTPVELEALPDGRYGLISGWRRCQALRALFETTGDPRFADVQGLLRRPEDAAEAYQAMVEENELRVGLSYYERARIAAKAVERGAFPDTGAALQGLFPTASRAKRSKIGAFLRIAGALDGVLRFPHRLAERPGLILSRALESNPDLAGRIATDLAADPPETPEAEVRRLLQAVPKPTPKTAAAPSPAARPGCAYSGDGIELIQHGNGHLTLQGRKVTAEFRAQLVDWLRNRS